MTLPPIRGMTKSKPFVAHCCEYCGRVLAWERNKCPYCKTELVE